MRWLFLQTNAHLRKYRHWIQTDQAQRLLELALSLFAGLIAGALIIFSWQLSSMWRSFLILIPIAFVVVMLVNDLHKVILGAIAISVPLNLDVSLIISPYSANPENLARGNRTIVALTELRLSLVLVLLALGYALWLLKMPGHDYKLRPFVATTLPALSFIFFSVLSVFHAQDWQLSFFRIVQLIELFLTYFYLANHIRTAPHMKFFVITLMWGMLFESALMIWQWITGETFLFAGLEATLIEGPRRVGGTLGGPNVAGGIISAFLPIVCAMMWILPKRVHKVFSALCLFLGCVALISTSSRASWGGFVMALLGFLFMGLRLGWVQREALIALFLLVLVIGGAFYQPIYTRLTSDDQGSAESRVKMAKLARNVIRAHPWWGVGANNYALVGYKYYTPDVGNLYVISSSVHNRYLLTWAETGLFGLLFFIALLFTPLVMAWRHVISGERFRSLMALGLGCALMSISIQMLAEHFSPRPSTLFIWMLFALITSLRNIEMVQSNSVTPLQAHCTSLAPDNRE